MFHGGLTFIHLTLGDKSVRKLGLHIWNQLPETLRAESSFPTIKKSLRDWFGFKCKSKVSSYLDN